MSRPEYQGYLDRFGENVKTVQRAVGADDVDGLLGDISEGLILRAIQNARLQEPPKPLDVALGERVELSARVLPNKYYQANRKNVLWCVMHDMEAAEGMRTAENVARYFAMPTTRTSAHYCADGDSIVPGVPEEHVAWCAKKGNRYGVHYELAGYAKQTREQWLDAYSRRMFQIVAPHVAETCKRWHIPMVKIGPDEVARNEPGICGHYDISKGKKVAGGHYDPGKNFPWDHFIELVNLAAPNV